MAKNHINSATARGGLEGRSQPGRELTSSQQKSPLHCQYLSCSTPRLAVCILDQPAGIRVVAWYRQGSLERTKETLHIGSSMYNKSVLPTVPPDTVVTRNGCLAATVGAPQSYDSREFIGYKPLETPNL
ncbi:hypothetical protein J6590_011397 [Homalodisca vitripennis]|nr:hypothetical protein J6590_011397 [Homalodisca vitripennis]